MTSRMRRLKAAALAVTLGLAFDASATRAEDPVWVRQPGSGAWDFAEGVAVDTNGNVYVAGYTRGAVGGPNKGGADGFLLKFDRDGHSVWKRQPGTPSFEEASGVAVDGEGNVYVMGYTFGSLAGTNKGDGDIFLLKFDSDGRYLWKRQIGTGINEVSRGLAVDPEGNVLLIGKTDARNEDVLVIKVDRDGHILWKRQPGTDGGDFPGGIATDLDGNVFAVGFVSWEFAHPSKGGSDPFVVKYDRDGRLLWKRQPGNYRQDEAIGVAVDAAGQAFVLVRMYASSTRYVVIRYDADGHYVRKMHPPAGNDYAAITLGGDGNIFLAGSTGTGIGGPNFVSGDVLVVELDADGQVISTRQTGSSGGDSGRAIVVDDDGNVIVAGATDDALSGPQKGNIDAFVLKFAPISAP